MYNNMVMYGGYFSGVLYFVKSRKKDLELIFVTAAWLNMPIEII